MIIHLKKIIWTVYILFYECSGPMRILLKPIHNADPAVFSDVNKSWTIWALENQGVALQYDQITTFNAKFGGSLPADGFIRGTITGAVFCSLEVLRDELVEEEEGDEEGTLEDSLSPLFMARTEWPTLVSRLLCFGNEFSERHKHNLTLMTCVIAYNIS